MADIILAGDSFSLKKLRNAAEQLEDAQNLMQKVYEAVYSTGFWAEANPFALLDGSKNMNVFDGTIDELNAFQQRVHQKEETLRTLAQRMETAVQEIAETDQSFRGKLNGESSVKRAWNSFWDSIVTAGKIASTPAIPILAAIGRLFYSESTVVGETPIEAPVQKKIRFTDDEIETIYGEFDWRGISVTDEEKTAIVRRASDKWEMHLLFEKLYNEKLDAMTDYERYRRKADYINGELPIGEKQNETDTQCLWAAMATILCRRQLLEGKTPSFDREAVYSQNHNNYGYYIYEHSPSDKVKFYAGNGDEYIQQYSSYSYGQVNEIELKSRLDEHPEGIMIFASYGSGSHAIVLTDYEVNDAGAITFYADDNVNNKYYSTKGRMPLTETWLYSEHKTRYGSVDGLFADINVICFIQ